MIHIATDCSGVGAPEQAIKDLGIEHTSVFACEKDKYARMTFLANHTCRTMYEDIIGRDNAAIPPIDLYVAGYPCQAFSAIGKKGGEKELRGNIFYHGYEFMKLNRPKIFILENVPGMLSVKGGNVLEKWLDYLASSVNGAHRMFAHPQSLNYKCYWTILNTRDFGIPQERERVFIVGLRDDAHTFKFPKGFPLVQKLQDLLEPEIDDKYYLSVTAMKRILKRSTGNFAAQINPDVAGTINTKNNGPQVSFDNGTTLVVNNNGSLEERSTVQCLDANYHKGMDNHAQRSFILGYTRDRQTGDITKRHKKDYAGTLHTATGGGGNTDQFVLAENTLRRLTERECFRLQGFPDTFDLSKVSSTQAYRQAGNSMSVPVIKAIIKNLIHNFN